MNWIKVLFTVLKSVAWYHLASSGLLISARVLSASSGCLIISWSWFLVKLACHMPNVFDRVPSNTIILSFTTLRLLVVKVDMQP